MAENGVQSGWMTLAEAATFLNYSENYLRILVREGQIKAYKQRGQWRFKREDLDSLFEGNVPAQLDALGGVRTKDVTNDAE